MKNSKKPVTVEYLSNNIIKIECKNATSNNLEFYVNRLNKIKPSVNLISPWDKIDYNKFGPYLCDCIGYLDNKLINCVIYMVLINNMTYTIAYSDKGFDICRYTYHCMNDPFHFNNLWEYLNDSFNSKPILDEKEKRYHKDEVTLSKSNGKISIRSAKHSLGGSTPFTIDYPHDEMEYIKYLDDKQVVEYGITLLRIRQMIDELKEIKEIKKILNLELINDAIGKALNSQLVKEIEKINSLCDFGFEYEDTLMSVVDTRKIKICNKDNIIEGIVLLDESGKNFIGISSSDENTLISGNLTSDENIVIRVNNQETNAVYNTNFTRGGVNAFEEVNGTLATISIAPVLGIEEAERDKIREKYNKDKGKYLIDK